MSSKLKFIQLASYHKKSQKVNGNKFRNITINSICHLTRLIKSDSKQRISGAAFSLHQARLRSST